MILLPNDMCCSLQSFAANWLKTKKLRRKVSQIKAQIALALMTEPA